MSKQDQVKQLRRLIASRGIDETNLKSLEALWPDLPEIIQVACQLEARMRGDRTPEELGAAAVFDLIKFCEAS